MIDEEIDRMADNFVNAQDFTRVYSVARKAECGAFWKYGFLAGLKAGRQQQSGIGWIDTAHIEIRLHDAVENIKKQLDIMLQEILGGNNKEC